MPYSVKGFFEINKDMVQILLMLDVLFTQVSKAEDLLLLPALNQVCSSAVIFSVWDFSLFNMNFSMTLLR